MGKYTEKPYRKIYGAPRALPHVILARNPFFHRSTLCAHRTACWSLNSEGRSHFTWKLFLGAPHLQSVFKVLLEMCPIWWNLMLEDFFLCLHEHPLTLPYLAARTDGIQLHLSALIGLSFPLSQYRSHVMSPMSPSPSLSISHFPWASCGANPCQNVPLFL